MMRLMRKTTAKRVKAIAGLYWRMRGYSSTKQAESVSNAAVRVAEHARTIRQKSNPDQSQLYSRSERADSARVTPTNQNPFPVMVTKSFAPSGSLKKNKNKCFYSNHKCVIKTGSSLVEAEFQKTQMKMKEIMWRWFKN